MRDFARPRVVVSKCLEFEACRWNGDMVSSDVVRLLKPHVDFHPVCPEAEIGLGIPREPVRIIVLQGEPHLVQHKTERDMTDTMRHFAGELFDALGEVDGFILKFRSPSCGLKDVNQYGGLEKSRS